MKETDVMNTFQEFYGGFALYDLTRQWITTAGPFKYDYRWLQPNGTEEQFKQWADKGFSEAFNVDPDMFKLLSS
ncbi:hypothetical protein [Parasphingorhabdus halotolerans]|uniref:Uncharacterized protein n=1 Tax=Parasphingorhabdus halotolerans TaxID=2725558 RepID=A0A6H2DQ70_9SPHN|nr:hypothetical protein [Parasphingorhabdus halotolerans]QJB69816.1 hypothetical protein HF685_11415 [Parasphingorhabdus halotolerans]